MSLLNTFVQVYELDARQADAEFKHVQCSIDDLIAGMKQAQTTSDKAARGVSKFASSAETGMAVLAEKTLDLFSKLWGLSSLFNASVARALEVESIDALSKN